MNNIFSLASTGPVNVRRSAFNLSHEKKMTADMGILYPSMLQEVVPGDIFKIGVQDIVRFNPMVAPMIHEVNITNHFFFVPYRLLFDDWELFITGGRTGDETAVLPRWKPDGVDENIVGSLWDYFGFPVGVDPDGALPLDFPKRAYNFIYNEYYRDQNVTEEIDITTNFALKRRAWEKDYFTSALPWTQRGTAPALPISGELHALWPLSSFDNSFSYGTNNLQGVAPVGPSQGKMVIGTAGNPTLTQAFYNQNIVDLSGATTFTVNDLRNVFQIQKWLERNARCGSRYTEFLKAHFGVSPRDERLQRPEYIGGSKSSVIISEVLQTSSTDATTPQGNLAGHGIAADDSFIGSYRAEEFGVIIGLLSVMPRSVYHQGVSREWLREDKYDFFFPEFAHLAEQPVYRSEIYANGVSADNNTVFGFQGRYNEMRARRNEVVSQLRPGQNLDFWTLARDFASAPLLNESFIECNPSKRSFAVPSEPIMIINHGNKVKAIRPLPYIAEPGLIDHI